MRGDPRMGTVGAYGAPSVLHPCSLRATKARVVPKTIVPALLYSAATALSLGPVLYLPYGVSLRVASNPVRRCDTWIQGKAVCPCRFFKVLRGYSAVISKCVRPALHAFSAISASRARSRALRRRCHAACLLQPSCSASCTIVSSLPPLRP